MAHTDGGAEEWVLSGMGLALLVNAQLNVVLQTMEKAVDDLKADGSEPDETPASHIRLLHRVNFVFMILKPSGSRRPAR